MHICFTAIMQVNRRYPTDPVKNWMIFWSNISLPKTTADGN